MNQLLTDSDWADIRAVIEARLAWLAERAVSEPTCWCVVCKRPKLESEMRRDQSTGFALVCKQCWRGDGQTSETRPMPPQCGPSPTSPLFSDVCNGDGREYPRDYHTCQHGKYVNDCDICLAMMNPPSNIEMNRPMSDPTIHAALAANHLAAACNLLRRGPERDRAFTLWQQAYALARTLPEEPAAAAEPVPGAGS